MAAAHILCVDDDPDTCACLSDVLADLGYRVSVAYSGKPPCSCSTRTATGWP